MKLLWKVCLTFYQEDAALSGPCATEGQDASPGLASPTPTNAMRTRIYAPSRWATGAAKKD